MDWAQPMALSRVACLNSWMMGTVTQHWFDQQWNACEIWLRQVVWIGSMFIVPTDFARNYAYQVLLLDELSQ